MAANVNYIALNGEYLIDENYALSLNNRAFRYGDAIFETIHANGLECQFLEVHYNRLIAGMQFLGYQLDSSFTLPYLRNVIKGVLTRSKLFQGARVKVTVMRKTGGLFMPQSREVDVLIEAAYLSKGPYELNADGLIVGVYTEVPKPVSKLFRFKTTNCLIYILAGQFAAENRFGDAILVNEKGHLVEATSSNLFCVKGNDIYTPALSGGAVVGTMRANIIQLAKTNGYTVFEDAELTEADLSKFDEVFFTNAIVGVKWAKAYKTTRYFKRVSTHLVQLLNREAGFSS